MENQNPISVLSRYKWVILVTFSLAILIAVVGMLVSRPTYSATSTLRVAAVSTGFGSYADYTYNDRLINTYSKIATSAPIVQELMNQMGTQNVPVVMVEIVPNTELLNVTVEDANPSVAFTGANKLAGILVAQSQTLYTGGGRPPQEIVADQLTQLQNDITVDRNNYSQLLAASPQKADEAATALSSIEQKQTLYASLLDQYEQMRLQAAIRANAVTVVQQAVMPNQPIWPNPLLIFPVAAVLGLIGGLGLAFLFNRLDQTRCEAYDIERVTHLPLLGQVPGASKAQALDFSKQEAPFAEAFRSMRTRLVLRRDTPSIHSLLITSPGPREGKSTVLANLAISLAKAGRNVVVVDADLRKPSLHHIFKVMGEVGLSNVLLGQLDAGKAIQNTSVKGVHVLASGPKVVDPADLFGTNAMNELISDLEKKYDYVLVDSPAALAVSDAFILARSTEAVVLTVSRGQTEGGAIEETLQMLNELNARTIGFVINRVDKNGLLKYYRQQQAV